MEAIFRHFAKWKTAEAKGFALHECLCLFLRLGVALHVCRRFSVLLYDVQGGMHTFGSPSLSLPSPALHSTLNRMAISPSFNQIDTYPHTHTDIHLVFVSKSTLE